jgi:hypothetical protein
MQVSLLQSVNFLEFTVEYLKKHRLTLPVELYCIAFFVKIIPGRPIECVFQPRLMSLDSPFKSKSCENKI